MALTPVIQAAAITGGVAILVGLIAAWGTLKATGRSNKHAARLFGMQVAEQARIRAEETQERRRSAFLAERQVAYVQLASVLWNYADVARETRQAQIRADEALQRYKAGADPKHIGEVTDTLDVSIERLQRRLDMSDRISEALETVRLLAPEPVAEAASAWVAAHQACSDDRERREAEFLRLARIDVGADPEPTPTTADRT